MENHFINNSQQQVSSKNNIELGSFKVSARDMNELILRITNKHPEITVSISETDLGEKIMFNLIFEGSPDSIRLDEMDLFLKNLALEYNAEYVSPISDSVHTDIQDNKVVEDVAVVSTQHVQSVYDNSAIVWAEVKINESKSADIYFLLSINEEKIKEAISSKSLDELNSLGNDLTLKFVDVIYEDNYLNTKLTDLESSRKYYYVACIKNAQGLLICDQTINTFETLHAKDKNYLPHVVTGNSYYNETGLNLYSPILTGSFANDAPYPGYTVLASFVIANQKSSLEDTDRLFDRNRKNDIEWLGVVGSITDFKSGDSFEEMAHAQRETSFYYRACLHYDVDASGSGYSSDTYVCGNINYNQAKMNFFN